MRHPLASGAALLGLLALSSAASAAGPMSRYYADDTEGIFWFLHITDLHVDTGDNTARNHLQFALGEVVDVAQPVAVFASGDLVDGTVLGIPTSGQDQAEWDIYATVLYDAQVTPSFYFDVPGNHDGYGDHGLTHYIGSSMQGQATNGRLFVDAIHTTSIGEYYFVGMNSQGDYATPFSFGNPTFSNVDDLAAGLQDHANAQLTFVFAHHHLVPHGNTDAQTVLGIGGADDPPSNVDEVLPLLEGAGAFYLHGHIHQYKESMQGGVVTVQLSSLRAEPSVDRSTVEDWDQTKSESNIGIGIVDHNAFIYGVTDTTEPWPFVAITAPVDVNLEGGGIPPGTSTGVDYEGDFLAYGAEKNPYAYDVCGDRTDNPVRALVLSKSAVDSVTVYFDGTEVGTLSPAPDPAGIYTGTLNTSGAEPGAHMLSVVASSDGITRADSIEINLTAGPCDPVADAGVDATIDAEQDAPAPDAGVPEAGSDAAPQDAGETDTGTGSGGAAGSTAKPDPDAADDGGCSCGVPSQSPRGFASAVAFLALGLLLRRRGR